jgi:multisubunit Na+/H+ antiporter MnhC subunit
MPTETVIVLTAIVAAFAIFGAVLAWAERQTHKHS